MPVYQAKRTSLVIIGGSVAWGAGLTHTETYAALMQNQVNATQGNSWAGWVPRNIHTDDVQPGGCASTAPFNGSASMPGYGAGPTFLNPVVVAPAFNGSVGHAGAAKLNSFPASDAPSRGDAGIFSNFGGDKTPPGGPAGAFTNPAVRLESPHQNIRLVANFDGAQAAYLQLGLQGVGSVTVYTDWNGAAGTVVNSTANQAIHTVDLGAPTTLSPQSVSVYWKSGTVDVTVVWPMLAQSARQTTIQVCARNSYCLQDYDDPSVLSLIAGAVINKVADGASSTPVYIVGDMFNSMITGAVGTAGDRRLSSLVGGSPSASSAYCTALASIANALSAGGAGSIILTCPFAPGLAPTSLYGACAGPLPQAAAGSPGLGWLPGESISTYGAAISALARAKGWGFVDQGSIPSVTTPGFFQPDGIHPSNLGATMIAQRYIAALSL
jgi:hypothetical protein